MITTCIEGLLCAGLCYKRFITLSHLILVITLCGSYYYYLLFTNEKTEAQRGYVMWPRSQN